MPLDLSKLEKLIEELSEKEKTFKLRTKTKKSNILQSSDLIKSLNKKNFLLPTEKNAYFDISNYFRLITISIDETAIALEIWIKGVLPIVLQFHGITMEEWDRICKIGDEDSSLESELNNKWTLFLDQKVQKGLIDEKIWQLISEGKKRVREITKL